MEFQIGQSCRFAKLTTKEPTTSQPNLHRILDFENNNLSLCINIVTQERIIAFENRLDKKEQKEFREILIQIQNDLKSELQKTMEKS